MLSLSSCPSATKVQPFTPGRWLWKGFYDFFGFIRSFDASINKSLLSHRHNTSIKSYETPSQFQSFALLPTTMSSCHPSCTVTRDNKSLELASCHPIPERDAHVFWESSHTVTGFFSNIAADELPKRWLLPWWRQLNYSSMWLLRMMALRTHLFPLHRTSFCPFCIVYVSYVLYRIYCIKYILYNPITMTIAIIMFDSLCFWIKSYRKY